MLKPCTDLLSVSDGGIIDSPSQDNGIYGYGSWRHAIKTPITYARVSTFNEAFNNELNLELE